MRLNKTFAASILAVILCTTAFSSDLASVNFFALNAPYSIGSAGSTVTVTGRVKTPDGRPIKSAYVTLKDADTNQLVRSTYSSSFGFYRLEQIEAGRLYVLSVSHKRYLFAFPAQLLEINEDRNGVDFTGEAEDAN